MLRKAWSLEGVMENICTQIAELTGHTPMKGTEPELIAQVELNQNQNQGMSR